MVLEEVLGFHRPDGQGIPTGAAFSPVLLDLACADLDDRLVQDGHHAFRYVDDGLVLFKEEDAANQIRTTVDEAIRPFDLTLHREKTLPYLQPPPSMDPRQVDSFPWLGHAISLDGDIDISEDSAQRFLADEDKHSGTALAAWRRHFEMARRGRYFQATLAAVGTEAAR